MARRPGGEAEINRRIARARGLSTPEAHRLAGLLDGESHLGIAPNNGDGWRCQCSVNLRDDDREILESYEGALGLGHLNQVAARNGSRPQVRWTVTSKLECRALVELLDRHPLRSRKLAEYEIWREAVRIWAARRHGYGPGGRSRLVRLAADLRSARAYRDPDPDGPLPDLSDQYAPHYFAGFFSGEGYLGLGPRNARLVIKLRRDDRPLLEAFRRDFRLGTVRDVASPERWSPAAVWHVTGARGVLKAIELFEQAPLLGRKARQYRAWRPGAEAVAHAIIRKSPTEATIVAGSRALLTRIGAYRTPESPLPPDDATAIARDAYLEVLKAFGASVEGRLSCMAYEALRHGSHPDWPQRETLARVFGSWYEALRCAGLEERAARRPSAR